MMKIIKMINNNDDNNNNTYNDCKNKKNDSN